MEQNLILGTLCNACGVKWKQGKIIIEESPEGDVEPSTNNSTSVTQPSKQRKSSISTGKATAHSSPAKPGKKPSRLQFNEGATSHTDEDESRSEKPRVSRRGSTAGASKRGRRPSTSSKKGELYPITLVYIVFET
jgi:hypothetical protein